MTTRGRKHAHLTVAAGVATMTLLLVACGNDTKPAAPKASAQMDTSRTPGPNPPSPMKPSLAPGSPRPTIAPTPSPGLPTTSPTVARPPKLTNAMLLTGPEVAKADPKRGWSATSGSARMPICGRASTRGDDALGNLSRNFTTDLDASGGQWLTRYADAKAARAAYEKILKTLKSCKASNPPTSNASPGPQPPTYSEAD
jgi:hypothetical protein